MVTPMSQPRQPRLPPAVMAELEDLDWSLTLGRKHWQLRIDSTLVTLWPRGRIGESASSKRNVQLTIHAIRKFKTWRKTS